MISEIQDNELDALLDLYKHLHRKDRPLPRREKLATVWSAICRDENIRYFVFKRDGLIISGCHLVIVPNLTRGAKPYAFIENVVTRKEYRNQGIGGKLVKHALEFAWSKDCYKVMLMTGRKNQKVYQFYESLGFDGDAKRAFLAKPSTSA